MLLKTYIKSYLQIPVVQGIGLSQLKSSHGIYLFKSNNLISIEDKIADQLKEYQLRNPNAQEFILPSINKWIYICQLESDVNFITISAKDNQVIKNFRARQLQQKLAESLDDSFRIFESIRDSLVCSDDGVSSESESRVFGELPSPEKSEAIQVAQVLEALNELSLFVSGFIGPRIVSNFWNMTKPSHSYMSSFHLKHNGQILFDGKQEVSPLEVLIVRQWTHQFIEKCDQVIRDLPKQIEKAELIDKHRKFISIYTAEYLHNNALTLQESDDSLFGDTFCQPFST